MSAERAAPSPFLVEHLGAIADAARLGPVIDLACGRGRHALACAARGLRVLGLDRDRAGLAEMRDAARSLAGRVTGLECDLEGGSEIPIKVGSCGAILVFCFLWRPLAPALTSLLAPGGLLVYETFTTRQRALGFGPRNPAFLLEPGELPRLFPDLQILESAEGAWGEPRPLELARLLARRAS